MTLSTELDRYLAFRRNLGGALHTDERILRRFVAFAGAEPDLKVSMGLIAAWLESLPVVSRQTQATRFRVTRLFAEWLHGLDPAHEPPPRGYLSSRATRPRPYIYGSEQVAAIIEEARNLPSVYGLRGLTCSTLFGLIAVTGLRINEAISLDTSDFEVDSAVLHVRYGKLGKERILPLHNSVVAKLSEYCKERDRLLGWSPDALFVTCKGIRFGDCGVRRNFALVCQHLGLRPIQRFGKHGRGPRIHDLRHTFAVRTMLEWYRTDADVSREMMKLTTWLGHASPAHTYWYIEAVPELLELAATRLSRTPFEEAAI